ncbi:hypothetical protein MMC14_003999 [Varicellaria rhodocarpa]|nr:hypothetical protein [Varicellaria rhodocarpa]
MDDIPKQGDEDTAQMRQRSRSSTHSNSLKRKCNDGEEKAPFEAKRPKKVQGFTRYRDLPPEIKLNLGERVSETPGLTDLDNLLEADRDLEEGLWKNYRRSIMRTIVRRFPEFEDWFGQILVGDDGIVTLEPLSLEHTILLADAVWKNEEMKDPCFEYQEDEGEKTVEDFVFEYKVWREYEDILTLGGLPLLNLIESLSAKIDKDLEALRSLPWGTEISVIPARKALLLLWSLQWKPVEYTPDAQKPYGFKVTQFHFPIWGNGKALRAVKEQPDDVRSAFTQILKTLIVQMMPKIHFEENSRKVMKIYMERKEALEELADDPMTAEGLQRWFLRQSIAWLELCIANGGLRNVTNILQRKFQGAEEEEVEWAKICKGLMRMSLDALVGIEDVDGERVLAFCDSIGVL